MHGFKPSPPSVVNRQGNPGWIADGNLRYTSAALTDAQLSRPATHARFGCFELTLATRELRGTNGAIVLQEQLFRALLLLLQGAGGFASRNEIRAKLWPDVTVRDFERGKRGGCEPAKALKDVSAAPSETEYIQTIIGRGYKLSEAPQWIYSASDDANEELEGLAGRQTLRLSGGPANQVRSSPADRDSVPSAMAQPQPLTRFRKLALVIAMLAVVAIAGFYYRSHRIKYLSGQDSVIVADFSNDTGDAVFDGHSVRGCRRNWSSRRSSTWCRMRGSQEHFRSCLNRKARP